MKRVAITTLGCKTNQFESAAMRERFLENGYCVVSFTTEADIYVINSCTVTARTDAETRRLIRRARRLNPQARIVATGCYAQVAPEELERLPEVDCVLGNREKQDIIALVESGESRVSDVAVERDAEPLALSSFAEHTRAFLQVQNGCNSFCTYCIVPYARGRNRSVPLEAVMDGIRGLADNGYQEVVLTGIHLGAYGLDQSPASSLTELLRRIDGERPVARLRIGSVEPNEVTDELLALMTTSAIICPHLHLPLQSGSNDVLTRMGRSYTADFFRNLMVKITTAMPHAFIGADVIAGFPGESDAEFQETVHLLSDLPFSDLHVFPYSRRPGTPAAEMPGQVPSHVVKQRAEALRKVATLKKESFLQQQIGTVLKVLVQTYESRTRSCSGLSRNYANVVFLGEVDMIHTECSVRISDPVKGGVAGFSVSFGD